MHDARCSRLRIARRSRPIISLVVLIAATLLAPAAPAGAATTADQAIIAAAAPTLSPAPALATSAAVTTSSAVRTDLLAGSRLATQDGWLLVHLEGTPYQIGYQRGYLTGKLASQWVRGYLGPKGSGYRGEQRWIGKHVVWPLVPREYRQELRGNVAGIRANGYKVDLWDLVAANAWADTGAYEALAVNSANADHSTAAPSTSGRCSAFVATGDATKDGGIVMGHNTWSTYDGDFMYRIIFDVKPAKGHTFRYQGSGGSIWSGGDWYVNDSGLMVCETSLDNAQVKPGTPVFVRIRHAVQYNTTIDQVVHTMLKRNNGAYPNEWLIGDAKTGEIASLQLGARAYDLKRTANGFYGSSNWATGKHFRAEADSPHGTLDSWSYARLVRWRQLAAQWYGKIDASVGETMLADHWDVYLKRDAASSRTICGHFEDETVDKTATDPLGAYDGKVMTSAMALNGMQMLARWGHPCGAAFDAESYMATHKRWTRSADAFMKAGLRQFDADTPNAWTLVGGF